MYDRRAIMKAAWFRFKYNRHFHGTFAEALHLEWINAKAAAARYDVWGDNFRDAQAVLLASNLTYAEAESVIHLRKFDYDFVEPCAAGHDYQNHRRTAWVALEAAS